MPPSTLRPVTRTPLASAPSFPPPQASVEAVRGLARAARLLEKASGELGLAHYRVLSAIAAGHDRASRVAERFELGRPAMSAAVDALSRAGLLERASVATDQRAVELRLTPDGRELLAAVEAQMVEVLDDLCARLDAPHRATEVLAALGGALDARARDRRALLNKPAPGGSDALSPST